MIRYNFEPTKTPQEIIDSVLFYFNLKFEDVTTRSRRPENVKPRQIIMYLLYCYTSLKLTEIGEMLGGRDHTTVIHAKDTVRNLRDSDPCYDSVLEYLTEDLGQKFRYDNFVFKKKKLKPKPKVIIRAEPVKFERPKATYTNLSSPYGIAKTA